MSSPSLFQMSESPSILLDMGSRAWVEKLSFCTGGDGSSNNNHKAILGIDNDRSKSETHREKMKLLFGFHPSFKKLSSEISEMISIMCVKRKVHDDNMAFCNALIEDYGLKGSAVTIHEKCVQIELLDEREMCEMKDICGLTLQTFNEIIRSEFAKEAESVTDGEVSDLDVTPISDSHYIVVRNVVKDILNKAILEIKDSWLPRMLLAEMRNERREFRDMMETIVACIVNKQARCILFGLKARNLLAEEIVNNDAADVVRKN